MKNVKIFSFVLFLLSLFSVYGNDWEFSSSGEHLIPLEISEMSIKKEKITLKLLNNSEMEVTVNFIFDNPKEGKRTIGFITPPDDLVNPDWTPSGEPYNPNNIRNFKTVVNGKNVKFNVVKLSQFLKKDLANKADLGEYMKDYSKGYTYYFEADFKKGENIVEHKYTYKPSEGSFIKGEYAYILTTISKWKNKRVDDFELIVDMRNEFFSLPYTFWKDNKKIEWEIVGEGTTVENIETIYGNIEDTSNDRIFVKMKKGYLRFREKNFSPDMEFYSISYPNPYVLLGKTINSKGVVYKDNLMEYAEKIRYGYENQELVNELKKLKNFELEVIKNYPYAIKGHDFSRKDLKDYFSKFFWYVPKGKVELNEYEYEYEYKRAAEVIDKILKTKK